MIEENYFTGVNWQTETNPQTGAGYSSMNDYLERQVFWNHTRTQFNSIQRNNHCLVRAQDRAECLAIMAGAGCAADVAR